MTDKGSLELVEKVALAACPPGMFEFEGSLGFKTEYGMTLVDENGANMPGNQIRWKVTHWPDAYCLESGECFWGGTTTHEDRAKLLVRPIAATPLVKMREALEALDRIATESIVETDKPDRIRWEGVWYAGPPATALLSLLRAVRELARDALKTGEE